MFKENNFPNHLEIPKKNTKEEKEPVSLREYQGSLHRHTGVSKIEKNLSPQEIIEQRDKAGSSNCAEASLEAVVATELNVLKNSLVYRTEHFYDGSVNFNETDPQKKEEKYKGITDWFYSIYKENPELLKKDFSREGIQGINDLNEQEKVEIAKKAEKLMFYDEKRAENAIAKSKELKKVMVGFECNVIPESAESNKLTLDAANFIQKHRNKIKGPIIASMHPHSDSYYQKFSKDYYKNPNTPQLTP